MPDASNTVRRSRIEQVTLCALLIVGISSSGFAAQADQKQVISQARQSYYSLKRLGLVGFRENVKPNWEIMLKGTNPDTEALKLLNGFHSSILFGKEGNVIVNHMSDFAPPNERVAHAYKQICDGLDKAIMGFFQTWNLFMFDNPF